MGESERRKIDLSCFNMFLSRIGARSLVNMSVART